MQKFRKNQEHNQIFLISLYLSSQIIFYKFHSVIPYFSHFSSLVSTLLLFASHPLSSLFLSLLLNISHTLLLFATLPYFSLIKSISLLSLFSSRILPYLIHCFLLHNFVSESAPSRQFTCWTLGLRSDQQHWLLSPKQVCSSHSFPLIAF